mgnify:CR=1 FL=1
MLKCWKNWQKKTPESTDQRDIEKKVWRIDKGQWSDEIRTEWGVQGCFWAKNSDVYADQSEKKAMFEK